VVDDELQSGNWRETATTQYGLAAEGGVAAETGTAAASADAAAGEAAAGDTAAGEEAAEEEADWSSEQIMNSISDIATEPAAWEDAVQQGSRTVLNGTRDGVDIRVIVDSNTGEIITGYPLNLPRNP
jgi:hypothetical protein